MADPLVQRGENPWGLGELEIFLPAHQKAPQFFSDLFHAPSLRSSRYESNALLHRFEGLARYPTFHQSTRGNPIRITQDFPVPCQVGRALRLVDAQPESPVELSQKLHHSLARSLRPHVDV